MLYCFIHKVYLSASLFVFLAAAPCFAANSNQNNIDDELTQIEQDFNSISREYYAPILRVSEQQEDAQINLNDLYSNAQELIKTGSINQAVTLFYTHIKTIKNNIDDDVVLNILALLLDNNEWPLVAYLFEEIESNADSSVLASSHFLLAKYYAKKHQWSNVNGHLEGIIEELSEEDNAYAYVLNGTALQYLKKHQQAIKNYKKVSSESSYYLHAQLNLAIANIRLGWLTDARLVLQHQLKRGNKRKNNELINRYYLVLGYALFQHGYNRDARETFLKISNDSQYTNRALLGRVLTLIRQGNYNNALLTLNQLKEKDSYGLPAAESYLMYPYLYEKQGLGKETLTSFSEASIYYQQRLSELNDSIAIVSNIEDGIEPTGFIINKYKINVDAYSKEALVNNWSRLEHFYNETNDDDLKIKIATLKKQYESSYSHLITAAIDKRIKYLSSYLNQMQYGLARLYDSNKKKQ